MTLFRLGVAFTELNADILLLHSRTAILEYLRLCSGQYTHVDLKNRTPYQRRRHQEAIAELHQRELVSLDERGIPSKVDIPKNKMVAVPTKAPWAELSLAELKVYIAVFVESRHSRSPFFRFTGLHGDLAEIARLNRKATGLALSSLMVNGLLTLKVLREEGTRWTSGTSAQLLDPQNGISLNDLAWVFINTTDKLSPIDKYREALKGVDLGIVGLSGYVRGIRVMCPFCQTPKGLRITVTEDEDAWSCSECKRRGDSNSMCAARSFWMWRQDTPLSASIAAVTNDVPMPLSCIGKEGTQIDASI